MYDEATRKRIDHVLKEQSNLTTVQRYKKRAEYLYQQGRFRQALEIYRELIDYVPESDMSLRAVLYYNMASIYAMDFDYRQSAEYYYESYLLNPDKQTKYAYILANKLYLTDYAYGNFKRENSQWNDEFEKVEQMCIRTQASWQESREKQIVTDLMELKQEGKIDEYYQQANKLIKQLKKDYKRQTQG
jgi:tetratricopeptide (TPR) repeat protein